MAGAAGGAIKSNENNMDDLIIFFISIIALVVMHLPEKEERQP